MLGPFTMFAVALLLVIASAPYAKHYVETRRCGRHLAVISQAARVWANAHNGRLPSGFIIMSNELVTPRLLFCPGDKSREPADNWQAFTSANSSYQIWEDASDTKDLPVEILQNIGSDLSKTGVSPQSHSQVERPLFFAMQTLTRPVWRRSV